MTATRALILPVCVGLLLTGCASSEISERAQLDFDRQDRNQDGVITEDDILNAQKERFKMADGNNDGALSREEFDLAKDGGPKSRVNRPRSDDSRPDRIRRDQRSVSFDTLDRDSDGVLSLIEFADPALRRFDSMDPNRDGQITQAEFTQRQKSTRARRDSAESSGGGRPPRR